MAESVERQRVWFAEKLPVRDGRSISLAKPVAMLPLAFHAHARAGEVERAQVERLEMRGMQAGAGDQRNLVHGLHVDANAVVRDPRPEPGIGEIRLRAQD